LLLAVLLRGVCLTELELSVLLPVVIASAGLGRWAGLVVLVLTPPRAEREGLARSVGQRAGLWHAVGGTVLAVPAVAWCAWLLPVRFGSGLAAVLVGACAWAWYVRRRLGGSTGDCLGFACYLGQVAFLLAVVARRAGK
jgi:adenosylcobinamide-GDP ribazoletransferase